MKLNSRCWYTNKIPYLQIIKVKEEKCIYNPGYSAFCVVHLPLQGNKAVFMVVLWLYNKRMQGNIYKNYSCLDRICTALTKTRFHICGFICSEFFSSGPRVAWNRSKICRYCIYYNMKYENSRGMDKTTVAAVVWIIRFRYIFVAGKIYSDHLLLSFSEN